MDPSTYFSASNPQHSRSFSQDLGQEAASTTQSIQHALRQRLSKKDYRATSYQLRRALVPNSDEFRLYEEHRFQVDLRDGSWLVLEVASAYVYLNDAVHQPLRYYRQKDNEKLNYTEGCLAQWPVFAKRFCDYYQRHKERRLFRRLDP